MGSSTGALNAQGPDPRGRTFYATGGGLSMRTQESFADNPTGEIHATYMVPTGKPYGGDVWRHKARDAHRPRASHINCTGDLSRGAPQGHSAQEIQNLHQQW